MNIDLSCFDKPMTAILRYEAYRQMIKYLTHELGKESLDCSVDPYNTCLEKYWGKALYDDNEVEYRVREIKEDEMCGCCKRKQQIINERKRCKRELGKAKRMLSYCGKVIMKEGGDGRSLLNDQYFNPLGISK
jgi:hypothetical protein